MSRFLIAALASCSVLALGACAGDGRTVLTVYSPHGKDLLAHYETGFEAAYPDADVQWMDMGSQEVLDRLRAERENPQADVWFGAPAEIFERAAEEELLEPFTPSWAETIPADAKDGQARWFGTYLTPEVIAFNTQRVPLADAPKDWDDVLDAAWTDRVVIRDPVASGTMRAIFGALLERSIRETGNTEAGWDWLRRLDAQTREYTFNPTILFEKLKRGDGWITLYNMPDIATLETRTGAPVSYVIPSSGTPMLVDAIAIVKGTRQRDLAEKYVEFVTSAEALRFAADSLLRIPARSDLDASGMPAWVAETRAQIRPMPLDRALMADSLDGWMRYWDSNIRNRSRR